MNVLFITRHYLDQMLGGPNCSKAFAKALATIYPGMTLMYPEHDDKKTAFGFLDGCPEVNFMPVYDSRSKIGKCADMYRGRLHRFADAVPSLLQNRRFDIIFIDHSVTASSGVLDAALRSGARIVTLHHNVESQYIRDNQQSLLFRLPYNHYSLKAEREAVLHSRLNLVLTEDDRRVFANMFPQNKESLHTVGVFEYEDTAGCRISNADGCTFVISGSLCAKQTETPVVDFLDNYTDILNAVCPEARLVIAGRNPSERIQQSARRFSNVDIIPNPEDLVDVVAKGNYYICPIYTGGGLKLRCMDALRVGLPVLAHKNAIRGYEAILGDGYMFAYSGKQDFADSLQKLLALKCSHADVAGCFQSHFSFSAGRDRLQKILSEYL